MTRLTRTTTAMAAAMLLNLPAFAGAQPMPPSPSEKAASGIEDRSRLPPAVKSAMDSQQSEIRRDNRTLPQVSVPLGKRPLPTGTSAVKPQAVDDSVARCLAKTSRAQRRDCLMGTPD